MSNKGKRRWTSEEKVAVVKSHLLDGMPVSELCEQHGFSPALYYQWQKSFFENGHLAFSGQKGRREEQSVEAHYKSKIERLEGKLREREEVVVELMTEHVALKKNLGDS